MFANFESTFQVLYADLIKKAKVFQGVYEI